MFKRYDKYIKNQIASFFEITGDCTAFVFS